MATSATIWKRLDKLIMEQTAEGSGNNLLFVDRQTMKGGNNEIKRGSKYIIGSRDLNAAESLRNAITDFLKDDDNKINDIDTQEPKEYILNVKMIDNASMTARLKTTAAKSTMIYSYEDVMAYIDAKEAANEERHPDTAAECRSARNKVIQHFITTGDKYYYMTKFSGAAYRLSYYDFQEQKTKQVSVGDILILVGTEEIQTGYSGRKKRTNRLTVNSEDVIARVWHTYIRVLPDDVKERVEREKLEKEKKQS